MPFIKRRSKARLIAKLFRVEVKSEDSGGDTAVLKAESNEAIQRVLTSTTDSNQAVIDTFDGTQIRAAHYHMSAATPADSDHQAQQIFLTHDGETATLTTYGTLLHGDATIVEYDASIDSADKVSLLADPQIANKLNFSFERVDVKKV